ncbi:MAG TPA: MATE family efflux transporter, partial [Firmicutes bacterium]|nr:MATE family efflux transporter [Bacillota bacterium]
MNSHNVLGTEPIWKLLLKYSIPAIVGMLVNAMYTVVDRIFIGNIPEVGQYAITGVGITLPISTIILACGMLVGTGASANISIKLGQQQKDKAERIIGNAFTLSFVIGILLMLVCFAFKKPILMLFGASDQTLVYADQFISVILLGTIFNIMGFALNGTIRADGAPLISALIMIASCVLNVILDPLFIFVFGFGIQGAAFATVLAQMLTAVCAIVYYTAGKSNLKFKVQNLALDFDLVKLMLAIGVAPFAMQLAQSFVQVICNNTLKAYGGDLAIGAMATISAVSMIFLMPIFGMNQGSQPIIGYNYGAKNYHRANQTLLFSTSAALVVLLIGWTVVQVFPTQIISLFNNDEELLGITVNGIRIYLMMLPLVSIVITGSSYFQSIGKAKIAMFLSLLRQLILLLPLFLI